MSQRKEVKQNFITNNVFGQTCHLLTISSIIDIIYMVHKTPQDRFEHYILIFYMENRVSE